MYGPCSSRSNGAARSSPSPPLAPRMSFTTISGSPKSPISSTTAPAGKMYRGKSPHPKLTELALDREKIPAADAVMIGDTPYDAEAARRANVSAIGLLSGGFTQEELTAAGWGAVHA